MSYTFKSDRLTDHENHALFAAFEGDNEYAIIGGETYLVVTEFMTSEYAGA